MSRTQRSGCRSVELPERLEQFGARGATVDAAQAPELAPLLGIRIAG